MGSKTSTRWRGHQRRLTVDECLRLPAVPVVDAVFIEKTVRGVLSWAGGFAVEFRPLTINYSNGAVAYRLSVYWPFVCQIDFFRVTLPVGKPRWLALCPRCYRRRADLYREPGGSMFLCRPCLGLAYASNNKKPHTPKYEILLPRRGRATNVVANIHPSTWDGWT
jgi:hypothetical protein